MCAKKKRSAHPLYPDLLFRLGHSHLESQIFLLPRRLHRLVQDSSTDPQIRRVLAIEGVVRLELADLRKVCLSLGVFFHGSEKKLDLRAEAHLHIFKSRDGEAGPGLGTQHKLTDRDGVFQGALGVHDIPLDYRVRRLELAELGVIGLAEQVFRDCR